MGSRRGGMDIEAVAAEDPSAIITESFPITAGISITFFFYSLKSQTRTRWLDLQRLLA